MNGESGSRRWVLRAMTTAGVAVATAGCLSGGSGEESTGDAGDRVTLASTTGASESSSDGGGDGASDGDGGDDGDGETSGSGEATDSTATVTTPDVDFGAAVESIEKCGTTCRTLTYAVTNRGADAAPDVTVRIRIFTGGKKVWDEEQSIGTVDVRSKRADITRDIDVGLLGGQKIKSNDGEITIELTPRAAGVSETFTFERMLDV